MLIKRNILDKIAAGEIDLAFRRWKRPTVKTGGRLRTAIGELGIIDVSQVDISSVSADEAARAGYTSRDDLEADLADRPDAKLYRISLRFDGQDVRDALRENNNLTDQECRALLEKLARLDRKFGRGAFSVTVLKLIEEQPAVAAFKIAHQVGLEKQVFKQHVRKLKEHGLTESLPVGYRLSPRGKSFLDHAQHLKI